MKLSGGIRKRLFLSGSFLFLGCSPLLDPIQSKGSSLHPFRGPYTQSCLHTTQIGQSTIQSLRCPRPNFQMPSRERQPQILAPLFRLLSFHKSWLNTSSLTHTLSRANAAHWGWSEYVESQPTQLFQRRTLINTPICSHPFHLHCLYLSSLYPQSLWCSTTDRFSSLLQMSHPLILSSSAVLSASSFQLFFIFQKLVKGSHPPITVLLFSLFRCVIH